MSWTALLPIKPAGMRKTRLATRLSVAARDALAERLLGGTLAALQGDARIDRVVILSPQPQDAAEWLPDAAPTLNGALAVAAAQLGRPLLVMLPDLPLVTSEDVAALLDTARGGTVLAVDRHGRGTNALAIADARQLIFRFGPDSLSRFVADQPDAAVLHRPGLAFDCDEPADLDLLEEAPCA